MKFPDRILGSPNRVKRFFLSSTLAGLLTMGCSTPAFEKTDTACSAQTLIHGEKPALTLRQKGAFTARAYGVDNKERDARVIIAFEPGTLHSGKGPNQLAQSASNEKIDLSLIIDASRVPAAVGIRYSFQGDNGDRLFATLATEAVGYTRECNIVKVKIDGNYPSLTVNNGTLVVPAFPM